MSVSVRRLRHYDELDLLPPAEIDPHSGYRRYSARQLPALNRIVALRDLGFSLDEIGNIVRTVTADQLRGMLVLRRSQLEADLAERAVQLAEVEARLRLIEREGAVPDYDIITKHLPPVRFAAVTSPAPGFGTANLRAICDDGFTTLFEAVDGAGIETIGFPFLVLQGDPDEGDLIAYTCTEVPTDVDVVPDPADLYELAEVPLAVSVVRRIDDIERYNEIYTELALWAEDHDYVPVGHGRDQFIEAVDDIATVTETQWPLRRPDEPAPDVTPHLVARRN